MHVRPRRIKCMWYSDVCQWTVICKYYRNYEKNNRHSMFVDYNIRIILFSNSETFNLSYMPAPLCHQTLTWQTMGDRCSGYSERLSFNEHLFLASVHRRVLASALIKVITLRSISWPAYNTQALSISWAAHDMQALSISWAAHDMQALSISWAAHNMQALSISWAAHNMQALQKQMKHEVRFVQHRNTIPQINKMLRFWRV